MEGPLPPFPVDLVLTKGVHGKHSRAAGIKATAGSTASHSIIPGGKEEPGGGELRLTARTSTITAGAVICPEQNVNSPDRIPYLCQFCQHHHLHIY